MAVFEAETERKPILKKHRDMWWNNKLKHPMNDADFVRAYCDHVFTTTTDYSIVRYRNVAYRFIRTFMGPELEKDLAKYREDYE